MGRGGSEGLSGLPEEAGIKVVPTTWLRLSDARGLPWVSKRQVLQLLPEVEQLHRAKPFSRFKSKPCIWESQGGGE